jgi:hypothetical protein
MKTRTHQNQLVRHALVLTALLAGTFLAPALRAQPAAQKVDNRFLLIFEISSDMKQRLPAVQEALNTLLATSANGQLHLGDSIGVWTFNQDLHAGQFPLQHWEPENAALIASNITKFVSKQHYSKKAGFDALQPVLNQVVQDSERLTVLIFCDGKGEIHGTPYDPGINQVFQQRQSERQKKRLPIVVGLRSQRGQYVGCAVSFPPQSVSLPEFPPLPEVAPAPPDASAPASLPQSSVPSLIIIGTTITNHVPPPQPKPAPANPPPMTVTPPPMTVTSTPAPAVANEVRPSDVVPLVQTSAVPAQPNITPAPLMPAKAAMPPPESPAIGRKGALAIGVAFLAGGLVVFMLRRGR